MLNNDERVVDAITRIVYDRQVTGAATVFLGDVRIATSVRDGAGNRATGTLMSAAVADDVLGRGRSWSDRAFVLNDWFISAYEPIRDPQDKVIGALYVGMPERPFLNIRSRLNLVFSAVLLFVSLIGVTLSTWISRRLARPVRALAEGARRIAAGEHIEPIVASTRDEIGLLADEFNTMNREVNSLRNTLEEKVVERTTQLEEKNQLLLATQKELAKAERLSGLGLLAAGVAHEINNPLAVIRGNAELLQDEIPAPSEEREEVEAIMVEVGRIERIVNNLRVLSRSGLQRVSRFSLGQLLDDILDQIGHQIALEPYRIVRGYWGRDREIEGDKDQLRQVFTNLIINGLQAMDFVTNVLDGTLVPFLGTTYTQPDASTPAPVGVHSPASATSARSPSRSVKTSRYLRRPLPVRSTRSEPAASSTSSAARAGDITASGASRVIVPPSQRKRAGYTSRRIASPCDPNASW